MLRRRKVVRRWRWWLVDAGADLEAKLPASLNSLTPLLLAVMRGQLETVKVFVEAGANVDVLDASGHTALELSNRLRCG